MKTKRAGEMAVRILKYKACSGYATDLAMSIYGKNRLSKPIFERSTSASGIKRTHGCKRPKQKRRMQALTYPAKR